MTANQNLFLRPESWLTGLAIALGGAIGALLRFLWLQQFGSESSLFPWAVFSENVLGAFLLGIAVALFVGRGKNSAAMRAFFGTGVIGSFTTFSGITIDLASGGQSGHFFLMFLYIFLSITAGLTSAFAGLSLGRYMNRRWFISDGTNREGDV